MRISVIIPIYNAEKTLRRCLDSIVSQMTEEVELILINDGSQDDSDRICCEYQSKYDGIKYLFQKNGGISAARNAGLAMANGDFITFVDSDDYVSEHYFTTLLDEHDVDFLFFSAQIERNGMISGSYSGETLATSRSYPEFLCKFVQLRNGSLWNKLFRAAIIRDNCISFPTDLFIGEDYVFCIRYLMKAQSAAVSNSVLYHVDESNGDSLSRKYHKNIVEQASLNYTYCDRAIRDSVLEEAEKRELLRWQSYNWYRTAFACVLEQFKKDDHSYRSIRSEIRSVLTAFHKDEIVEPLNIKHRMIKYFVEHKKIVIAYVIAWLRFLQKSS